MQYNNYDRFYAQRVFKNNDGYQVSMPQGNEFFTQGKRKNFQANVNQHQQRSEIHQYNQLQMTGENAGQDKQYGNKYYDRSLGIKDIEGTQPGTLISKVVKNKDLAQNLSKQNSQAQTHSQLQKQNPDALDNFLRESQTKFVNRNQQSYDNKYSNDAYYSQDQFKSEKQNYNNQGNQRYNDNKNEQEQAYKPREAKNENYEFEKQSQLENLEKEIQMLKQQQQKELEEKMQELQKNNNKQNEQQQKQQEKDEEEERQMREFEERYKQDKLREQQEQEKNQQQEKEYEQYQQKQQQNQQLQYRDPQIEQLQKRIEEQKQKLARQKQQLHYQGPSAIELRQNYAAEQLRKLQEQKEKQQREQERLRIEQQKQLLSVNNNSQLEYKLDINGFPVLTKKTRMNPTNFSYAGEELKGMSRNEMLSYDILGNQIKPKSKNGYGSGQQARFFDDQKVSSSIDTKHFNKYPGEPQYNNKSDVYHTRNAEQPDLEKQQEELEQRYQELQRLRQQEQDKKQLQEMELNQNLADQYKTKESQQQNKNIEEDPEGKLMNYDSEYANFSKVKPELQVSKHLGPYDSKYAREVYHPREHSHMNALGNIPNEPKDKIEIAKEITRKASGQYQHKDLIEKYEQELDEQKKKFQELEEKDPRFTNDREKQTQKRIQELKQHLNEEVAGYRSFQDKQGNSQSSQFGHKDLQGAQFQNQQLHGGKVLKNLSNFKIY